MARIQKIEAREVLDSKGNPTVEVELVTDLGEVRASVPSGVSTGKYEALELRDKDIERYNGMGVLKAVENVNKVIAPKLIGKNPLKQKEIDDLMIKLDGTENKSKLGTNAILPVSIAVCRAGALAQNLFLWKYISRISHETSTGERGDKDIELKRGFPRKNKATSAVKLPSPCMLLIEGGLHAGNDLDIQEFMIVPTGKSFKEKLETGTRIYNDLKEILKKEYGEQAANVGDEGGFAAPLNKAQKALDLIIKAIRKSGSGDKIQIVLDVAASHFYKNGKYKFEGKDFSAQELLNFYADLVEKYPILGIEDPFDQEDWKNFKEITKKLSSKMYIIGDDFLVTNIKRIKKAIQEKTCNALILKPNQVGTVSETIEAAKLAVNAGWEVFVKHRGGETNDDFIADLAVGLNAKYIMAGAPARGERMAKYNRLLEIEEQEL
ncbi:MAG: phosphopyruvate hydratase [Candidatus Pacebacteria bacterium]|nr:phosphopyruvate hydratase [Candidatus Paceibacterota bacterium]